MDPFKKMVETVIESIGGKNKKVKSYFDFSKLRTSLCNKGLVAPIFTEESIENCVKFLFTGSDGETWAEVDLDDAICYRSAVKVDLSGSTPRGETKYFTFCNDNLMCLIAVIKTLLSRGVRIPELYIFSTETWGIMFSVNTYEPSKTVPIAIADYQPWKGGRRKKCVFRGVKDFFHPIKGDRRIALIHGGEYQKCGKKHVLGGMVANYLKDNRKQVYGLIWKILKIVDGFGLHCAIRYSFNTGKLQFEAFEEMSDILKNVISSSILGHCLFELDFSPEDWDSGFIKKDI